MNLRDISLNSLGKEPQKRNKTHLTPTDEPKTSLYPSLSLTKYHDLFGS